MYFYQLLVWQTAEPRKLSYLFPLFLCSHKAPLSNPKTIQKPLRAGRQINAGKCQLEGVKSNIDQCA